MLTVLRYTKHAQFLCGVQFSVNKQQQQHIQKRMLSQIRHTFFFCNQEQFMKSLQLSDQI